MNFQDFVGWLIVSLVLLVLGYLGLAVLYALTGVRVC